MAALSAERHDAHRDAAAVQHVLRGVRTDAAGGTPDQHDIALLHRARRCAPTSMR